MKGGGVVFAKISCIETRIELDMRKLISRGNVCFCRRTGWWDENLHIRQIFRVLVSISLITKKKSPFPVTFYSNSI